MREYLDNDKGCRSDRCLCYKERSKQPLYSVLKTGSHIVSDNRDTSCGHTNYDRDHDLEKLHDNADDRHRDLRILCLSEDHVHGTVFSDHIVDGCHCCNKRDLGKKAGHTEYKSFFHDISIQSEICFQRLDYLHMYDVEHCQDSRCDLSDHCGKSSSHHSPFESKYEYRIKDNIDHCPCKG